MRAMIMFLASAALVACAQTGDTPDLTRSPPVTELAANPQAPEPGAAADKTALAAAVAGEWRTAEEKARDAWRHPVETLDFFGVAPGWTVVEVSPGGGWYTQILAPYLAQGGGTYVAMGARGNFAENFSDPRYGSVKLIATDGCEAGTADAVLTFRNVHNWMGGGSAEQMFQRFAACLKPGGVLGVVEHRLPEDREQDPKAASGYVKESEVIRLAEAAGFKLAGKSEVNANPKDDADHPLGVWTLPPVRRSPKEADPTFDRAAYDAIGESDRMTLKFVKAS